MCSCNKFDYFVVVKASEILEIIFAYFVGSMPVIISQRVFVAKGGSSI